MHLFYLKTWGAGTQNSGAAIIIDNAFVATYFSGIKFINCK